MSDQKSMKGILRTFPFDPAGFKLEIYQSQRDFTKRFVPFDDVKERYQRGDKELYMDWIHEFVLCIMDELSEILNWLPWKHWKTYESSDIDDLEVRFELVDIYHFLVNIAQVMDLPYSYLPSISSVFVTHIPVNRVEGTKRWIREMLVLLARLEVKPELANFTQLGYKLVEGMANWGMTNEDLFNYFMSKQAENRDRQARGY